VFKLPELLSVETPISLEKNDKEKSTCKPTFLNIKEFLEPLAPPIVSLISFHHAVDVFAYQRNLVLFPLILRMKNDFSKQPTAYLLLF